MKASIRGDFHFLYLDENDRLFVTCNDVGGKPPVTGMANEVVSFIYLLDVERPAGRSRDTARDRIAESIKALKSETLEHLSRQSRQSLHTQNQISGYLESVGHHERKRKAISCSG